MAQYEFSREKFKFIFYRLCQTVRFISHPFCHKLETKVWGKLSCHVAKWLRLGVCHASHGYHYFCSFRNYSVNFKVSNKNYLYEYMHLILHYTGYYANVLMNNMIKRRKKRKKERSVSIWTVVHIGNTLQEAGINVSMTTVHRRIHKQIYRGYNARCKPWVSCKNRMVRLRST